MDGFKRGDIYYVEPYYNVGSEQRAGRPAIIISNNVNNEHSPTLEVVYLTTQPKNDMPTHVTVFGTGRESIALCEQVHTVDYQRLGNYCGSCTKQEMEAINIALMVSIGLDNLVPQERVVEVVKEVPVEVPAAEQSSEELVALRAKLDMMQTMYDNLLKQLVTKQVA